MISGYADFGGIMDHGHLFMVDAAINMSLGAISAIRALSRGEIFLVNGDHYGERHAEAQCVLLIEFIVESFMPRRSVSCQ